MKINQLRFKNLNSLAGEWSIDFTSPEYVDDGIFAISGPTGAGKSTILDAICLALYGRTPRLRSISKANNEIMSRQTGECFTEVVFETQQGKFRAFWSQRRAREKPDGALQNPTHELSEAETGKLLTAQLTATANEIEKKTGMDYGRFVQSMMLAQGGFAAFLQASGNERAPILEQITGTEIYSSLSKHVFDCLRTEKTELEKLKAENQGIILLSEEEEIQTLNYLKEHNDKKPGLAEKVDQLDTAIKWLKTIETLKTELVEIEQDEVQLTMDNSAFGPKRAILDNALKALPLEGEFAALSVMRNQQAQGLTVLDGLVAQTPELTEAQAAAQSVFNTAEKLHTQASQSREELLKVTSRVRLLDQGISQKKTSVQTIEKEAKRLFDEKEAETAKKNVAGKVLDGLRLELKEISGYLTDNQADSALAAELTGIRATVAGLTGVRSTFLAAEKQLGTTIESLNTQTIGIDAVEKLQLDAKAANQLDLLNITRIHADISGLLQGKTVEFILQKKDDLLMHLAELKKIAGFEEERGRLQDGKPCPLCGSHSHPYAEGNIPQPNESEIELAALNLQMKNHAALLKKLTEFGEAEKISAQQVTLISHQLELALQQKQTLEGNVTNLTSEVKKTRSNFITAEEQLKQLLKPFGIAEIPAEEAEITTLIARLDDRRNKWQAKEKRNTEIDRLSREKQADMERAEALIQTGKISHAAKVKEADEAKTLLNTDIQTRKELFGDKIVHDEETRLLGILKDAEKSKELATVSLQEKTQHLLTNTTRISDLQAETRTRKKELEKSGELFTSHLSEAGFPDEIAFVACQRPSNERAALEKDANLLQTRKTQLEGKKADRQQNLVAEEIKHLTTENPDVLAENLELTKKSQDELLTEIGALNQKLETNQAAKTRGAEIDGRIKKQTAVYDRWAALSSLIGSADGKKYRNFAQGLTLEIMVSYANNQLVKLSDRYLLTRDKNEPLELNVLDNYQAGEIRSTKNLSGGESFIVSLALALGLSRMSSRNVRVDSLFLDEGFGTLDEETLETALGTLAGLKQDGKMIGVISHVGAMKERINTRITVEPIREGRSFLSGPGCRGMKVV